MYFFWPRNGWKRTGQYVFLRLQRLKGTPSSIAAGFACGVAISFTPFVGFHFTLAAITAWLMRGNIIASAIGTAAGNPWTFPFIWISSLYSGREFLKFLPFHYSANEHIDFLKFFPDVMKSIITLNADMFINNVWPIMFPMLIGSIPFYIVSWLISYFLLKNFIEKVNHLRAKRKEK